MKNTMVTASILGGIIILQSCGRSGSSEASNPVETENTTPINVEGSSNRFDDDTELTTSIQGFTVENVYIVDGDDKKISSREVALNTQFSIVFEGVKNYTLKDGKVLPGLSIQVMDNNQNT